MARKLALALLASVVSLALTGCETASSQTDAAHRGMSTIPWNRPAKWEGGGMLGSQLNGMRGY